MIYGSSDELYFPALRRPFPLLSKAAIVIEQLIPLSIQDHREKVQLVLKVDAPAN